MPLFGIIGYPLTHSFSPGFFKEKFAEWKLQNHEYRAFPLEHPGELPELIQKYPELIGLNVTIPHKEAVIGYLDSISDDAAEIGAVNTIRILREPTFLQGFNTDAPGFLQAYERHLDNHDKALILGSGGASKAVRRALLSRGLKTLTVSRTYGAADTCRYADLDAGILSDYRLIVNTTPLGMTPDTASTPAIPFASIGKEHTLIDLIYNPAVTELMQRCIRQGAVVENGLPMLYAQALLSWEIWNS